ncbi:MAG TPA: DUF4352 domain-containing protein [Methanocorpusculum sp.]|nr:DUF4352 domain-containing protein [Methanocorpusculum sp.]
MVEDDELFGEGTPLKLCNGCYRYFEEDKLRRCRICGQYFCPDCQKTHDCRLPQKNTNTTLSSATLTSQPAISSQKPVYTSPDPVSVVSYPGVNQHVSGEQVSTDKIQCFGCGKYFEKSELRKCHKCGAVLCKDCQKHHKCSNPENNRKNHTDAYYEPNLANEKTKKPLSGGKILLIIIGVIVVISVIAIGIAGIASISAKSTPYSDSSSHIPTTQPTKTSSNNDYSVGDYVEVTSGSNKYITGVTQVIRGEEAHTIINKDKKYYTSDPANGYEYIMFQIYIKNIGSKDLSSISLDYTLYANGIEGDKQYFTLPDDYKTLNALSGMLPGAETYGWYCYEIPVNSDVIISFSPLYSSNKIYYKIGTAGTSGTSSSVSTPTKTPTPKPTTTKYSIGNTFTVKNGDDNFVTGVTEYKIGDEAYSIVNQDLKYYTRNPADGNEYMLFKVIVKNLGDEELSLINIRYTVYADGVEASKVYYSLPDAYPSLSSLGGILPGAKTEGWYCYEVPKHATLMIGYNTFLCDDKVYYTI